METRFLAAYYGYYSNDYRQAGYDFRFHDLPAEAQASFRQLKDQFDWPSGGGQQRYGDCYSIWPVNADAVLAARFRDMGVDANYGRPHTLRIEVVLVTSKDSNDWPAGLTRFLSDEAWSQADTTHDPKRVTLDLSHEPSGISPEILAALKEPGLSAVLFTPHQNVRTKEMFRVVQSPGTVRLSSPQSAREIVPSSEKSSKLVRTNAVSKPGGAWVKIAVSLVVGLAAGIGGAYFYWVPDLNSRVGKLTESEKSLTDKYDESLSKVTDFLQDVVEKNARSVTDVQSMENALSDAAGHLKTMKKNAGFWLELVKDTKGKPRGYKDEKFSDNPKPKEYLQAIIQLESSQNKADPELALKATNFERIEGDLKTMNGHLDEIFKIWNRIQQEINPEDKSKKTGIPKQNEGRRSPFGR